MDDTVFTPKLFQEYNTGPTRSWAECLEQNIITEQLHRFDFSIGRGMCIGKYINTLQYNNISLKYYKE